MRHPAVRLPRVTIGALTALLLLHLGIGVARAESTESPQVPKKTIWITEFGPGLKLDHAPLRSSKRDPNWSLLLQVGLLRRTSDKTALGGVLFVGGNDRRSRFGVKYRQRRYLSSALSIEASPGIVLGGWASDVSLLPSKGPDKPLFPAPAGSLALNYRDLLVPTLEAELDRTGTGFTDLRWYGTLELGRTPGKILAVATIVGGGIILAAVASSVSGL